MIKSYNRKVVGNMLFRKAKTREAEAIRALYQAVIGTPFCTWDESYPGETEIAGDLSAGTLYVLEEDHQVIGAISIVPENELDHFNCWALKENAREFARVVIKSDQQHQGLSVYLVEGVIRELQRQGVAAIHIAVAKENIPAQKLYRKTGFVFAVKPICTDPAVSSMKEYQQTGGMRSKCILPAHFRRSPADV